MIKQVSDADGLDESCVTDGKAAALFRAYGGGTDFCRFYRQDDALLVAVLDSDYVICTVGGDPDFEELAAFVRINGFNSLLAEEDVCSGLEKNGLEAEFAREALMEYRGGYIPAPTEKNPPLDDVYAILKSSFGDIPYEPWLLDTSHRIRHGVSDVYVLGKSTCTVLFDHGGYAFVTQVATAPEERGKGSAKRLLQSAAGECSLHAKTRLVCREAIIPFYEKCGFERIGTVCRIYNK